MTLQIRGHVAKAGSDAGVDALWVEVWHLDRLVARAAEPTGSDGRFSIDLDYGGLARTIGDAPSALTLRVLRQDGSELALASPTAVAWPTERKRVTIDIQVELPAFEPVSVTIDAISSVLERPVPQALRDRLNRRGISTLEAVRTHGLIDVGELTPAQERAVRALEAHARLEVLTSDAALAGRLVTVGVASISALAQGEPAAIAENAGIDVTAARELRDRALVQRWAIDQELAGALISQSPANIGYRFNRVLNEPIRWQYIVQPSRPDPDACQTCDPCESALSPAAYLVDLIDFLIDHFKQQVVSTGSTVTPRGFPNLKAIEDRFRRPFGALVVDCEKADQKVRQIEIAIEVLERFVLSVAGGTVLRREDIYERFGVSLTAKPRFPHPDVVSETFDEYLGELGITRVDFDVSIKDAYPASASTPPDPVKLNALLARFDITEAALQAGLGLTDAKWKPHVAALDWLPELVRTFKTKGFDPDDVTQLLAYRDALAQADAAIDRVMEAALPKIRANLISYAIFPLTGSNPRNPAIATTRQLGDYLHIDLEVASCARTTRLANAIEAIQSWVEAFRTGREDPGYFLMFADEEGSFEQRWRWLRTISLEQAAQSILLYPENFLLPTVRQDASEEFSELLEVLGGTGADRELVGQAVRGYLTAVRQRGGEFASPTRFHSHYVETLSAAGSFHNLQKAEYANLSPSDALWNYLDEWYLFLPLAVAEHMNGLQAYEQAAAWLHNVFYPYAGHFPSDFPNRPVREVWAGFPRLRESGYSFRSTVAWLKDPFDPFAIARVREGAFLRHAIIRYVENLLDWADAEFARDTSESIARARELYELAETILGADEIPPEDACLGEWRSLLALIAERHTPEETRLLLVVLAPLLEMGPRLRMPDFATLRDSLLKDQPFNSRLQSVKRLVDVVEARPAPAKTLDDLLRSQEECQLTELAAEDWFNLNRGGMAIFLGPPDGISPEMAVAGRTLRRIGCGFCVPPNPLLSTLRFRIAANLEKIRTCRNIIGIQRAVQAYAPSADPMQAVQLAATGQEVEEAIPTEPPPVHRFSYLIERARYYTDVARQLESQLLNAFEREDAERYSLLKARQDARAAGANISLHDLRVTEATDGVTLAQHQRDRARDQKQHFTELLATGLLAYEREAISRLWTAHDWTYAAAVTGGAAALAGAVVGSVFGPGGTTVGTVLGGIASAIAGGGQVMRDVSAIHGLASQARSLQASYERRREDWELQNALAEWDRKIGEQTITLANDRVAIAGQEREIARLQNQFAGEVVEFLGAKFLNIQAWQWMGRFLRRYYRDHLNFATVTARMAQRALEFERQESIPIVATFYGEREKRDLLAAEQLLTDVNKLDQHRLTTEKRKRELTKTISLAQFDPVGFRTLQQDGWMTFATPMSMFDRDFPGHYLRLIKNVSLTIVALVPPSESIRATLSNAGLSRAIVGQPFDQPRVIQRQPESIAVSIASNSTGLFELRLDDPILLPFEGAGVDTTWTLEMPKGANRFDYDTLADVLITMRYTALEDATYREKVLRQLGMTTDRKLRSGGTISYPLRTALPDEWYDLHHPSFLPSVADYGFDHGQTRPPYAMQFDLQSTDFPPNEIDHAMARINVAFRQSRVLPVPMEVWFRPASSTKEYELTAQYNWDPNQPSSGPISAASFSRRRTEPSAQWQTTSTPLGQLAPFGTWRLRLRNEDASAELIEGQEQNQNELKLDWLQDLLFVIDYEANTEYRYAGTA